jgi:hypothetical protein
MFIFLYNPATNPATNVFLGGLNWVIKPFGEEEKGEIFRGKLGVME